MTLAQRIKLFRKSKNWTMKEFGERLGVSWNFVALMESGKSPIPLKRLKLLIKLLGMNKNLTVSLLVKEYENQILEALK